MTDTDFASTELEIASTRLSYATYARDTAIINARDAGLTTRQIARLAGVSPQTVLNIIKRTENHQ